MNRLRLPLNTKTITETPPEAPSGLLIAGGGAEESPPYAPERANKVGPVASPVSTATSPTNAASPTTASPTTASPASASAALPVTVSPKRIPVVTNEADGMKETVWSDGTIHWGERHGDTWVEKWQTQEGDARRFGTKRGRDVEQNREWQERWEERDGVLRVEKKVVQYTELDGGEEVEKWVERLEMGPARMIVTKVGHNVDEGRQWRTCEEYKMADGKRHLQLKETEEKWTTGDYTRSHSQLQETGRVMKTVTQSRICGTESKGQRFDDMITRSAWGSKESRRDNEVRVEEWEEDAKTGAYRKSSRIARLDEKKSTGKTESYSPESGELYKEEWGLEEPSSSVRREWSTKWRKRDLGHPWGDHSDVTEECDAHGDLVRKTEKGQKWYIQDNGAAHRESWTHVHSYKNGKLTGLEKSGHNEYGHDAKERWSERYDGGETPVDHFIEKDNSEVYSVEMRHRQPSGNYKEYHKVFDKRINQTDEWNVDEHGMRWGEKHGSNAEGVEWHEHWGEFGDETWVEKKWRSHRDEAEVEWGELWGKRGFQNWSEKWGREGRSHWRERNEVDEHGNAITRKDGEQWSGDRLVDKYSDHYGKTADGEKWAYKKGYSHAAGEWLEKWNETELQKRAEKSGANPHGDSWSEQWCETFDASGNKTVVTARKLGSNAQGDQWIEEWTEEGGKKYAQKTASRADESWLEEWSSDADGSNWCRKWATKDGHSWGQEWGQESDQRQWGKQWEDGSVKREW